MRIYTKSGDDGTTGLFHGPRVAKDDARIDALGTVDELCSIIGISRSQSPPQDIDEILERLQHQLFSLGAELATPDSQAHGTALLGQEDIGWMEAIIDRWDSQLEPLTYFVLPGGTPLAASLHYARVVCRRAERRVVTLSRVATLSDHAVGFLNRAGDMLFVLARSANAAEGYADVRWQKPDA